MQISSLLLLSVLSLHGADATASVPAGFTRIEPTGHVLESWGFEQLVNVTLEECAAGCLANAQCLGFDYNPNAPFDIHCQLESYSLETAVSSGMWSSSSDFVFYNRGRTCNEFCELVDLTWLNKDCSLYNTEAWCTRGFVRSGDTHTPCKWVSTGLSTFGSCQADDSSPLSCPASDSAFGTCRCTSISGWSDRKCRRKCDLSSAPLYDSDCSTKCSATCPANARRLTSLRGASANEAQEVQLV
mmetsp:Transcript_75636/g.179723  ORF Transcript_75636/g.179723 Transcript_75636/m.179723 type:complete len:243 (-) Transcript_75636:390-1118(-)|eukprot:CAMPEP_0178401550 /NCGR_PEP_ID=MMETSP0689_2-20121128/16361_1 /TAXON_ID=160604 /ORGANISM="Amphidinium massartii, Strain CS-259" /LENGTH=242 /DNA_ID=CAMNT_0020022377 /DNA_START=40 /DNA_END=768 /DNA_ORIENTATION=+